MLECSTLRLVFLLQSWRLLLGQNPNIQGGLGGAQTSTTTKSSQKDCFTLTCMSGRCQDGSIAPAQCVMQLPPGSANRQPVCKYCTQVSSGSSSYTTCNSDTPVCPQKKDPPLLDGFPGGRVFFFVIAAALCACLCGGGACFIMCSRKERDKRRSVDKEENVADRPWSDVDQNNQRSPVGSAAVSGREAQNWNMNHADTLESLDDVEDGLVWRRIQEHTDKQSRGVQPRAGSPRSPRSPKGSPRSGKSSPRVGKSNSQLKSTSSLQVGKSQSGIASTASLQAGSRAGTEISSRDNSRGVDSESPRKLYTNQWDKIRVREPPLDARSPRTLDASPRSPREKDSKIGSPRSPREKEVPSRPRSPATKTGSPRSPREKAAAFEARSPRVVPRDNCLTIAAMAERVAPLPSDEPITYSAKPSGNKSPRNRSPREGNERKKSRSPRSPKAKQEVPDKAPKKRVD